MSKKTYTIYAVYGHQDGIKGTLVTFATKAKAMAFVVNPDYRQVDNGDNLSYCEYFTVQEQRCLVPDKQMLVDWLNDGGVSNVIVSDVEIYRRANEKYENT